MTMSGKKHSKKSKKKMSYSHYKLYKNGYIQPMKSKKFSIEIRKHMSEGSKGKLITELHRANISKANKGKTLQELNHKSNCQCGVCKAVRGEKKGKDNHNYGKKQTEDWKQNISKSLKGKISWDKGLTKETDERIKERSQSMIGRIQTQITRKKISESSIKMWNNPKHHLRMSKQMKKQWQNDEYREKVLRNLNKTLMQRPTKLEQSFIEFFSRNTLPFKYVGDGKLIIGGKIPDFVETNGKKIVLEVGNKEEKNWRFGDWKKYELERINHFEKNGWKCLVFWDCQLDSEEEILKLLEAFGYSISNIAKANTEELKKVKGIGDSVANAIKETLK